MWTLCWDDTREIVGEGLCPSRKASLWIKGIAPCRCLRQKKAGRNLRSRAIGGPLRSRPGNGNRGKVACAAHGAAERGSPGDRQGRPYRAAREYAARPSRFCFTVGRRGRRPLRALLYLPQAAESPVLHLAVPEKRFGLSLFPRAFRPLRKQRLSFICRRQRRARCYTLRCPKNASGFRFFLAFFDRCGNRGSPSSATGSGEPLFHVKHYGKRIRKLKMFHVEHCKGGAMLI